MSVSDARIAATTPNPKAPAKRGSSGVGLTFLVIALAAVVVGAATFVWGLPVLTMAALPLALLMFVFFIWISLP